jgi:hypothetical protein
VRGRAATMAEEEASGGDHLEQRRRRRGDQRGFWDESEMTRDMLLFIGSKISATILN